MPEADLHGNAPDTSPVALVLIDMINDLEFPGGESLLDPALRAAERIVVLQREARSAGVPVIYANDNFGRWRSDFRDVLDHCLSDPVRGRPLAKRLLPGPDDYFVLKPKHSAFFATTFETLLDYLGVRHLVLTGIATEVCVMFTAIDAYMRDYQLSIPSDCVASDSPEKTEDALHYLGEVCGVNISPSDQLDFARLVAAASEDT